MIVEPDPMAGAVQASVFAAVPFLPQIVVHSSVYFATRHTAGRIIPNAIRRASVMAANASRILAMMN